MPIRSSPYLPSRRRFLAGLGAAATVPVVLPTVTVSAPATAAAPEVEYECLADLVASGEVTRADFMVG